MSAHSSEATVTHTCIALVANQIVVQAGFPNFPACGTLFTHILWNCFGPCGLCECWRGEVAPAIAGMSSARRSLRASQGQHRAPAQAASNGVCAHFGGCCEHFSEAQRQGWRSMLAASSIRRYQLARALSGQRSTPHMQALGKEGSCRSRSEHTYVVGVWFRLLVNSWHIGCVVCPVLTDFSITHHRSLLKPCNNQISQGIFRN